MDASSTKNGSDSRFSANRSNLKDASSPFFLHHSDNSGLVLVSQTLTGDNYASWSRAMLIALSDKNKLGFVNGTLNKPEAHLRQSMISNIVFNLLPATILLLYMRQQLLLLQVYAFQFT
ncbi:hypothetical protein ACOSQ4_007297 [Xanthoceras sorbifolium]